jgi:phosphate transport system substrate-binding protein
MKKLTMIVLFVILAAISPMCLQNNTSSSGAPDKDYAGTIRVSGAFALYPMMVRWGDEYETLHPGVKIDISAGGAGKGMTDVLSGQSDLGMVSREVYPEEIAKGAVWVSVTKDAVVPTMNRNNPVASELIRTGMTKSTFSGIFIGETITSWGMAVQNSNMKSRIHAYTRSDSCGAGEVWAKYLGYKQEDLKGTGVYGDPGISEAIKNDPLGIGYNNLNYAYDPNTGKPIDGLLIVPLDLNANGRIDPDEDFYGSREALLSAIDSGRYPSPPARELNLVAKDAFSGQSREFVGWILTDGQQYIQETGYIPLPGDVLAKELQKIGSSANE